MTWSMNNLELARGIIEGMERLIDTPIPLKLVTLDSSVCDMDISKYCAHAHWSEDDKLYGRICVNPPWLEAATPFALRGIMAHEVAHFVHAGHGWKHERLARRLWYPNPFRRAFRYLSGTLRLKY